MDRPATPPPMPTSEQQQILAELRAIRVHLDQMNHRLAGGYGGAQVKVFWKVAWGIVMAQVLVFTLVLIFWLVFAVFLGGALAAAGAAAGP